MKIKIFKILLLNLTLVSTVSVAEVYKCKSDTGNISYSFEPCESTNSTSMPKSGGVQRKRNELKLPVNALEVSPLKDVKKDIRKLLVGRKFKELSRVLDGYQRSMQKNIETEEALFVAYDAFEQGNPEYDSLIRSWVKEMPNTYQANLALGVYYAYLGWESRGSKWASETDENQFSLMNQFFSKAKASLEKSISINPKALVAYSKLIGLSKADSDMGDRHDIVRDAIKANVKTYKVRQSYLKSIKPRWGGSYQKMKAFVDDALKHAKHNPKLLLLEGMIYTDVALSEMIVKRYSIAEGLFADALGYGENHVVLNHRGRNFYRQKKYRKAIKDLNRAIEISPEIADYYYWRSKSHYKLKVYSEVKIDILKAVKLNPFQERFTDHKENVASKIIYEGYELVQGSKYADGIKKFTSALELTPNDADIFHRRGLARSKNSQYQSAVSDLGRAIVLSPDTIRYYISIDYHLSRKSDWNSILKYWDKFISNHPNNSRAYVERAGTHFHNGNAKAALRDADKARSLGDNNASWVHEKLGQS